MPNMFKEIIYRLRVSGVERNRKEILGMCESLGTKQRICEVGPGPNPLILTLPGNIEFYGIEFPGNGEETLKVAQKRGKALIMKEADLNKERWPFDDNEFDAIVSNQVIEHLYNTDYFFEEFYRILKPGGYGIISTPNLSSLHNIVQLMLTFQPFNLHPTDRFFYIGNPLFRRGAEERQSPFQGHLRLFALRGIMKMLSLHNFKIEKIGRNFYGSRLFGYLLPYYLPYCTIKVRKP